MQVPLKTGVSQIRTDITYETFSLRNYILLMLLLSVLKVLTVPLISEYMLLIVAGKTVHKLELKEEGDLDLNQQPADLPPKMARYLTSN